MKEKPGNRFNRWEKSQDATGKLAVPSWARDRRPGDWIEAVSIEKVPGRVRDLFRAHPDRDELELGVFFDDTRPGVVDLLVGPFAEMALPYDHVHHDADFPGQSPLCVLLQAIEEAVFRGEEPENPHMILFQRSGKALPCALRQGLSTPYDRKRYPGLAMPPAWQPPEESLDPDPDHEPDPTLTPQAEAIKQFTERERPQKTGQAPEDREPAGEETDQSRVWLADYHDSAPSSLLAGMNCEMAAFTINETMVVNEGGEMTLAVYFSQEKADSLALDFQDDGEGLTLKAYDCLPLSPDTRRNCETINQLLAVIAERVRAGQELENPHFFTINMDELWIAPLSEDRDRAPLPQSISPRLVH